MICKECGLEIEKVGVHYCLKALKAEVQRLNLQIEEIKKAWNSALADGVDITPRSFEPLNHAILAVKPKGETTMVCLESRPLPVGWDGSPKGCWEQHPKTREICQLPPDGHTVHERDDASGVQLLRWAKEKRSDVVMCSSCGMAFQPAEGEKLCRECEGR